MSGHSRLHSERSNAGLPTSRRAKKSCGHWRVARYVRPLFSAKLNPLQDERDTINHEMALFLDEKLLRKGWTANQRKMPLFASRGDVVRQRDHHEMVALFDRHSEVTLADMAVAEKKAFAVKMADAFGIELDAGAVEASSTQDVLDEALRQIDREEQEHAQAAEARAAAKRGGKKSARAIQAEQQAADAGKTTEGNLPEADQRPASGPRTRCRRTRAKRRSCRM